MAVKVLQTVAICCSGPPKHQLVADSYNLLQFVAVCCKTFKILIGGGREIHHRRADTEFKPVFQIDFRRSLEQIPNNLIVLPGSRWRLRNLFQREVYINGEASRLEAKFQRIVTL